MKRTRIAMLVFALVAVKTAESVAAEPFSTRSKGPVQQSPATPSAPPYVKPEAPAPQGPVQRVSPTAPLTKPPGQQADPVERIQVTESTKLEELLAKPDTTIVVSADGKQSTTVGDLRRQIDARQRGIADIQSGKSLTGGSAKVRFPQGTKAVSLMQQSGMLETSPLESARSKQATTKSSGLQESLRSRDLLTPQPGISTVNDRVAGYIVSPQSYLTIKGRDFGDFSGTVNAVGSNFPTGATPLRVVRWRANEIYALVPPEIRGVMDHQVSVQVITRDGKAFSIDGGRFFAAREDIVVRTRIPEMIRLESSRNWMTSMTNEGLVYRGHHGVSIDCPAPGKDRLRGPDREEYPRSIFSGRGFVLVGLNALWGPTDSGNGDGLGGAGSRTFFPGYGFGDWYGRDLEIIDVSWGVWRSHTSPGFLRPARDFCSSSYQIEVVLFGPAGVAPF